MRWIIGDIHGLLTPLRALLDLIHRADPAPTLYFTGDYVNRGPDSSQVLDLLLTLTNARFIRGNHDDILDQILHRTSYAPNATRGDHVSAFTWFMQHGLLSTFLSYGADYAMLEHLASHPNHQKLDDLLTLIPQPHRDFIHNLIPVIEDDDMLVMHGKWDPDSPDHPNPSTLLPHHPHLRERLLWGRFTPNEILRPKAWRRPIYFGHTPVDNYPHLVPRDEFVPILGPKIILLDTASALTPNGRLTAACHELQTYHQSDRAGRIVTVDE